MIRSRKNKYTRLKWLLILLISTSLGVYIILANLQDNIVFFYPPSEINKIPIASNIEGNISGNKQSRVGGIVKENSIKKLGSGKLLFTITDYNNELNIEYDGVLPALFREKQGIVAEGILVNKELFIAKKLLTKHDENYMPLEVYRSLKK